MGTLHGDQYEFLIIFRSNVLKMRPQKTGWGMRIVCRIPKATNAHSEYVTLFAFPLQQCLRERASMLRYSTLPLLLKIV